jgi:hypothetical protein
VSRDHAPGTPAAAIVALDEIRSVALSYQGERPVEAVLGVITRT